MLDDKIKNDLVQKVVSELADCDIHDERFRLPDEEIATRVVELILSELSRVRPINGRA